MIYTVTSAAKAIGCDKSQTSRHARRLGLGTQIGRSIVLTAAEVARLKRVIAANRPGNPNFVKGNHFGQPPQKRKGKKR